VNQNSLAQEPGYKRFKLAIWLAGIFCLSVLTGCQSLAPDQSQASNSFTNFETEVVSYVYGPPPVLSSEVSDDYLNKFHDAFRWQLGVAAFKENFRGTNAGEARLQFHLNSNGSMGDLIILTNTIDDKMEDVCKSAISAKNAYESWPKELCQIQYAGYFTIRTLILYDYATNFSPDLRAALGASRLTGTTPTNIIEDAKTHFEADPAYLEAGLKHVQTTNYAEAMVDFSKAVAWDSEDAWAYIGLGNCLVGLKDFDGAMTNLSRAVELDPQNATAWNGLAIVKTHFRDYAGVVSDTSKAIALNADFALAYRVRAYAKKRLQDLNGALDDSEQSVRLDPTNSGPFFTRGQIRYCLGDYTNALSDCNRAIELNAHYADAYNLRGAIQQAQHSPSAALASFQTAFDIDPNMDYSRFQAWVLRCEAGDTEAATKELKRHFSLRPKQQSADWSYEVEAFLTGSLSEGNFLNAAGTSARTSEERTGQLCEANYYAGVKRLLAGDKKSAADFFQKSLATGVADFGEYIRARDELKTLQNVSSL
jgi:tetratricopeptide (TPR) repeat protein